MQRSMTFASKKSAIMSLSAVVLTVALTAVSFVPRTANGAFDLTALEQQVQDNTNQLNNHEARITNNEKDIQSLQQNTNTAPAPDHVAVPSGASTAPVSSTTTQSSTTTPTATQTPQTAPPAPTVVKVEHVVCGFNLTGTPQQYNGIITHYSDSTASLTASDGSPAPGPCGQEGTW